MGTTQSQPDQDPVPTNPVAIVDIVCSSEVLPVTIQNFTARVENPPKDTEDHPAVPDIATSNSSHPSEHFQETSNVLNALESPNQDTKEHAVDLDVVNLNHSPSSVHSKESTENLFAPKSAIQDTKENAAFSDMAEFNNFLPLVNFKSASSIPGSLPSESRSAIDQLLSESPAKNLASVTNVPEVLLSSTISDVLRVLEGDGRPCVLVRDVPLQGSSAPPQDAIFRRIDIFHVAAALGCAEKPFWHIIEHLTPLAQVDGDASLREVRRAAQRD